MLNVQREILLEALNDPRMADIAFQLAKAQVLTDIQDLARSHSIIIRILTPDFWDFLAAAVEGIPILGGIFKFVFESISIWIATEEGNLLLLPAKPEAEPPIGDIPPGSAVINRSQVRGVLVGAEVNNHRSGVLINDTEDGLTGVLQTVDGLQQGDSVGPLRARLAALISVVEASDEARGDAHGLIHQAIGMVENAPGPTEIPTI